RCSCTNRSWMPCSSATSSRGGWPSCTTTTNWSNTSSTTPTGSLAANHHHTDHTAPRPASVHDAERRRSATSRERHMTQSPTRGTILIDGGTVVSVDPEIGILERGQVLIDDGAIVDVGTGISAPDAERIDATDMIVM